jgi:hypothetical protein
MLAGAVPSSEYLIESRVLDTAVSSVVFSNLDQFAGIYKHFQIVYVARDTYGAFYNSIVMRINGATSGYSWHVLEGNGSTVASGGIANTVIRVGNLAEANASTGIFAPGIIDILDPHSSTKNTTVRSFAGVNTNGGSIVTLMSGAYLSTTPVNSISFHFTDGQNAVVGSRFSIYGVTA